MDPTMAHPQPPHLLAGVLQPRPAAGGSSPAITNPTRAGLGIPQPHACVSSSTARSAVPHQRRRWGQHHHASNNSGEELDRSDELGSEKEQREGELKKLDDHLHPDDKNGRDRPSGGLPPRESMATMSTTITAAPTASSRRSGADPSGNKGKEKEGEGRK